MPSSPYVHDYAYDHLGQRVLKLEYGYIAFEYDIFGNMMASIIRKPGASGKGALSAAGDGPESSHCPWFLRAA